MLQLLIVLLTVVVSSSTACPTMCVCRHFPREAVPKNYLFYTEIKCSGFSSNTTLDNSTRILEVSDSDASSFANLIQCLIRSDLPDLNSLILKRSDTSDISDLYLLDRINYLALPFNNLTMLPTLPENSSSLLTLDLSSNKLSKIPSENSLRTLRALETLNLSENSLTEIESGGFNNLENLKCLDLSKNNLSRLENKVLTSLTFLQFLNLSHNHIEVLSEQCFSSLDMLQQLDVSWNRLALVAPGSLQLPSLARLLLEGNTRLGGSRDVLVGVGRKLQSVDVSQTGLKQVPAALTHSIRTLRLAGNSISTISCGDLDPYPLLQLLDFSSNEIELIEEDAMGRLESLSILYLTDNKIRNIPKSLPEQLTVLHLKFNNIEKVSGDDLDGLSHLEVLLLNDNNIKMIGEGAFRNLRSLVTLDLSRNPIFALYPGSLSGPLELQVLRLSGIDAVFPATDVSFPLSTTDHLITLDLSQSPGLARQLLADTAALASSRELQELDISGADVEFIPSDLLHFLSQLRILHVKNNRLNCGNLQWLAIWMRRQDQVEYRDVVCANPPDLWGTSLLDLQYVEVSPIKPINYERERDNGQTINLEPKTTAAESNNPLEKHVSQGVLQTPISNNSANTMAEANNNVTSIRIVTEPIYLESEFERKSINNNSTSTIIPTIRTFIKTARSQTKKSEKSKLDGGKKQTNGKKVIIKNVDKTLLSRATFGRPSSVRVTNGSREEYSSTKGEQAAELSEVGKDESDVNQAEIGKGTKRQSSDQNYPENLPTRNSNEHAIVHNKAPALLNLIFGERILNNTTHQRTKEDHHSDTTFNLKETTAQWNGSSVEMSMYTTSERPTRLLHPGMLILAAGVLCGVATLAMLATRFNSSKKRVSRNVLQQDIEVASLPSVTELW